MPASLDPAAPTPDAWLFQWLDSVASGEATMSQRAVSSVEKHGGIDLAVKAARERNVHLVRLTDDKGRDLIAASRDPFHTLC